MRFVGIKEFCQSGLDTLLIRTGGDIACLARIFNRSFCYRLVRPVELCPDSLKRLLYQRYQFTGLFDKFSCLLFRNRETGIIPGLDIGLLFNVILAPG